MIKIGFIHFDEIYLIHHFLGSAAELYKDPECQVDILTPDIDQDYLFSLLKEMDIPHAIVKKLSTYTYKKWAYKIQKRKKPSNQYIFKKHKKMLLEYDALVFTVMNHGHLKRQGRTPKYVMLMHGAGDAEYPFIDIYKDRISQFDLITTAGQKINDLFKNLGDLPQTKIVKCGYQKLDVVKLEQDKKPLFDNNKPTVLYNPHYRKHISSFHKFGIKILDFFYHHSDYNLIFAPHFNLFSETDRDSTSVDVLDEKYFKASNIHIDTGSIKSVNMNYTLQSDIYIGDVSSQIYEFLIEKAKPIIFINTFNVNWEKEKFYKNWHLGLVISDIENLNELLSKRNSWQKQFEGKQLAAMEYTFDISNTISSSKRVAKAIKKLVE